MSTPSALVTNISAKNWSVSGIGTAVRLSLRPVGGVL
nr:MAG TPA: hypothetical protein [Caudoviricetes sp.]